MSSFFIGTKSLIYKTFQKKMKKDQKLIKFKGF